MVTGPSKYQPALDGVRAVAVGAVVLFHAGPTAARGGFLGVSLFFTLSGFLITRLVLFEHDRTGRIDLAAFWGRRVRRLAPAAMLCLALVLIASVLIGDGAHSRQISGDIVGAALNVANWRFIAADASYGDLFSQWQSPVLHFWSLAIEEQFYFVFPVLLSLVIRARRLWVLPLVLVAFAAASVLASLTTSDVDLAYYGTQTRMAELLIGALLAVVTLRKPWTVMGRRFRLGSQYIAAVCLVIAGWLATTTNEADPWLYSGGFAAVAILVWCPIILAATTPGFLERLLSARPLVAIGRRSYGIYLFHWPVLALATPAVTHLNGWQWRCLQVFITAALTEFSYRLVERPVRSRRVLDSASTLRIAALATVAGVVVAAIALPSLAPTSTAASILAAPDQPVLLSPSTPAETVPTVVVQPATDSTNDVGTPPPTTVPRPPVSVVVFGGDVETEIKSHFGQRIDVTAVPTRCLLPLTPSVEARTDQPVYRDECSERPDRSDIAVIVVSQRDHDRFQALDALQASIDDEHVGTMRYQRNSVAQMKRFAGLASFILIVDDGSRSDFLGSRIEEVVLSQPNVVRIGTPDLTSSLEVAVARVLEPDAMPTGAEPKLMVIGDSTSYLVAVSLSRAADAPFEVLWAGANNCPIVPVDMIKYPLGDAFSVAECPTTDGQWAQSITAFRPDVLLIVSSVPEEIPQRYPGEQTWHSAGDERYKEVHRAGFDRIMEMVAKTGTLVMIADAPPSDGSTEWASEDRIQAWNDQIFEWDQQWAAVSTIDYSALIVEAERNAGHTIRPDGVHVDPPLIQTVIGEPLAAQLLARIPLAQQAAQDSGCRVRDVGGYELVLDRCR